MEVGKVLQNGMPMNISGCLISPPPPSSSLLFYILLHRQIEATTTFQRMAKNQVREGFAC